MSVSLRGIIQSAGLKIAALAGYNAALPNKVQAPATRLGTNPNDYYASGQRIRLSLEGENAVKNTSFAVNYIAKRSMYCTPGPWCADTGDAELNKTVNAYVEDQWKRMGVMCSMRETFNRVANVFQPQYGDAALRWYRDERGLRLLEITGDRIGEQYTLQRPVYISDGRLYCGGLYFRGPDVTDYKIYERSGDTMYVNPKEVPARDIIFFRDDISGGVRGVSAFFAALEDVNSRYQILKATKDTMQQQSKTAAIASNNSGGPSEFSYETRTGSDGQVEYVETYADGAVVKYQFNGDSYQVLKAEHPTDTFINGMRYLDASAALAMRFPYEFLFSAAMSGGAPARFAFEAAGKEILRLRKEVLTPRLDVIAYMTIMDGVNRKKLPPRKHIARGSFQWPSLPSADAFRDVVGDIKQVRAGLNSPQRVIATNLGASGEAIISETTAWAVMVSKARQEANKQLVSEGYEGDVMKEDIAQVFDNPVAQPAEDEPKNEPVEA